MMSFLNLVLKDSPCENPFASRRKCGAEWVGNAIGATAQTIGDIIGFVENNNTNNTNWDVAQLNAKMQRETNAKNYEIAQQTNAMNRAMLHEQNAFNEKMYERQLAYNSPQHMVELYKAAGLNPAALAGNANQVAAAGELRSGEPKPAERAQMVAPQLNYQRQSYDWNSAANNIVNAYNQSKLVDSETRKNYATSGNIEVSTQKEMKGMSAYLQKLRNEAKREGWQGRLARQEFNYLVNVNAIRQQLVAGDYAIQQKNLSMLDEQMEGLKIDNHLKQIQAIYQPMLNDKQLRQMDATIGQISAQIGLINANKLLTDEQRLHEVEKKAGTIIDNNLKDVEYDIRKEVKSSVIQSYKNSANEGMYRAFDAWKYDTHGNSRGVSDHFGVDNFADILGRQFKKYGFKPKF